MAALLRVPKPTSSATAARSTRADTCPAVHRAAARPLCRAARRASALRACGAALSLGACQGEHVTVQPAQVHVAAAHDRGERCLDVADTRVCWGGPCGEVGCIVPRPGDTALVPPSGFRCAGQGRARTCQARAAQAGPFVCAGTRCVQEHPRVPDNGEWDCVDIAGVVYCRKVVAAAGVLAGPLEPGFACGTRRGEGHGELICVDFAPDPAPLRVPYACSIGYSRGVAERVCAPSSARRVGAACDGDSACPAGTRCVGGRCLPGYPRPACWLDGDCDGAQKCHFGSCTGGT